MATQVRRQHLEIAFWLGFSLLLLTGQVTHPESACGFCEGSVMKNAHVLINPNKPLPLRGKGRKSHDLQPYMHQLFASSRRSARVLTWVLGEAEID